MTHEYTCAFGAVKALSADQINRLAQTLSGASALPLRVGVAHQPVAVMHAEDATNLLRSHAEALHCWSAGGVGGAGGHSGLFARAGGGAQFGEPVALVCQFKSGPLPH